MSFLAQIRGGLATAQLEVSKHVNAASIHRAIENVQNSIHVGSAASQIDYLRNIATGHGNRAVVEQQSKPDNGSQRLAEAVQCTCVCPHVEIAMTCAEDAFPPTNENPVLMDTDDSSHSFVDGAQAAARRLGKAAWENPVLTAATVAAGAGLLVVAAPVVVTTPLMGLAGAAGFTPAGIAASSAASVVHAGIGNAAAGSIFATLQSAAAGGYGFTVLTGAAQAAGGAVAGAGVSLGGLTTFLKSKPQPEQPGQPEQPEQVEQPEQPESSNEQ